MGKTNWPDFEAIIQRAVNAGRVQGGSIASDLKRVMPETILTEDGSFGKGKISGMDYQKCLIRWVVGGVRCWEDQSLFAAYQRYSAATMEGEKGLCMLSGEIDTIAKTHDKGIIPAINGAKLISSNDIQGFTFRGRFTEASQACTIGYTASQKAHKALRWLAVNQGVNMAGRTFICWNPKGLKVVEPMRGLPGLNMRGDRPATPTEYRENLKNTLLGYRNELSATEKVVIAAFDAATTGRMALTYYSELTGSDFLDHVEKSRRQLGQTPPLTDGATSLLLFGKARSCVWLHGLSARREQSLRRRSGA